MNTKTVNYSVEQVDTMRTAYEAAKDTESRAAVVAKMAEDFKKSTRSVISKMSREGFYIKKEAVSSVTGATPAKKEALAVQLRDISDLPMVSAEKLNKTDLQDLIQHFTMFNKIVSQMGAEFVAETIADFDAETVETVEGETVES